MADVTKKEELEELENDNDQNAEGAGADENNNDQNDSASGDQNKDKKKEKTFTQEQVSKMMAREKNQGRNAVYNELGIDPKDPKMVAMVKALIDSQKSDEQKAQEAQNKATAELQEAQNRAAIAEAKAEAMQLGVKPQYVEDAITLALSKLSDDTDLKTILDEFKTKYPIWFEADENEKNSVGKKGTGSSVKQQKQPGKDGKPASMGARLAAQRKTNAGKKSYWSK